MQMPAPLVSLHLVHDARWQSLQLGRDVSLETDKLSNFIYDIEGDYSCVHARLYGVMYE
jgi:hypothetical protein